MSFAPTTRASLLFRLRDPRDHEAWVEFVSLYEPVAYRLLRRAGLQDADAREVMQDLFMAVSRNIERWDPSRERGSFRGWLSRVARNLLINWLKQRGRRASGVSGSDLHTLLEMIPAAADPETLEFDLELRRAIFRRAAEQVQLEVQPATWRAFWQTAVLGDSAADTAKKIGMQAGAVRVAKCRVLARLQAVVRKLEETS